MTKIVRIAVSLLLLGWVAWHTDWPQLGEAFAELRIGWWLGAVGLLVVAQLVSARRWQLFARALELRRSLALLSQYYLIGMYFNLMLPTSVGGDVVRAWYLDGGSGRRPAAIGAVVLDRLSGLVVLFALALTAIVLSPRALPTWMPWSVVALIGGFALGLAIFPLGARLNARVRQQWTRVTTAFSAVRSPGLLARTTALSLFVQLANVGIVWLVSQALRVPVPADYLGIVVPMVSLLALLPISVNGMGVREGAMVVLLAPVGVGRELALSLALLWFGVFLTVSLVGGVVYLFGRRPLNTSAVVVIEAPKAEDRHGLVDRDSDQGRTGQFRAAA